MSFLEQRIKIKFCYKLGKIAAETLLLLQQEYGDEAMCRLEVFKWYSLLKYGRDAVTDGPRSGRPVTAQTKANIQRVGAVIRIDRRQIVDALAEQTGISHET